MPDYVDVAREGSDYGSQQSGERTRQNQPASTSSPRDHQAIESKARQDYNISSPSNNGANYISTISTRHENDNHHGLGSMGVDTFNPAVYGVASPPYVPASPNSSYAVQEPDVSHRAMEIHPNPPDADYYGKGKSFSNH